MFKHALAFSLLLAGLLFTDKAFSQPPVAPTNGDLLCSVDTSSALQADTLVSTPDSNGFYSIFDGKTFKGWWQNCRSTHSQGNRTLGAIFRVDTVHHAIYAQQRNGNFNADGSSASSGGTATTQVGGLLATHKRYAHYELIFDWWPDYGNDGGVFNRFIITSSTNVASNQMVLDYMDASGILSYYSEANWPGSRNGRPWTYTQSVTSFTAGQVAYGDTVLAIPGSGGNSGDLSNWTTMTQKLNPTQYGCASTGCVANDYRRLWPRHGWVQVRERYYGGLGLNQPVVGNAFTQSPTGAGDKLREQTWFRKYYPTDTSIYNPVVGVSDTAQWVPVVQDSCALTNTDLATYGKKAPFAFQVHFQTRYRTVAQGGKGSWYRNIRVRELDSLGNPTFIATAVAPAGRKVRYDMRVASGALVGNMDLDHIVTVSDVKGRVLTRISGIAGRGLRYELPTGSGVMFVQVKTARGAQNFRVNRASR